MGEMDSKSDSHHKREWTDAFSIDIFSLQIQGCASLPREHIWYVNIDSFSVSDKLHCMCAAEPSLPIVLWILADFGCFCSLISGSGFHSYKRLYWEEQIFFFLLPIPVTCRVNKTFVCRKIYQYYEKLRYAFGWGRYYSSCRDTIYYWMLKEMSRLALGMTQGWVWLSWHQRSIMLH